VSELVEGGCRLFVVREIELVCVFMQMAVAKLPHFQNVRPDYGEEFDQNLIAGEWKFWVEVDSIRPSHRCSPVI